MANGTFGVDDTLTTILDSIDTALGCSVCPGDTRTNSEVLDDIDDALNCLDCPPTNNEPTVCDIHCAGSNNWMPEEISLSMSGWDWTGDTYYFNEDAWPAGPWFNAIQFAQFCSAKTYSDMYPENADFGPALNSVLNSPITLTKLSLTPLGAFFDPTGDSFCLRGWHYLVPENGMVVRSNIGGGIQELLPFWMVVRVSSTPNVPLAIIG